MTAAGGWVGQALAAGRIAAQRGDLWLAGALASLGYLGWLPLVLTVVAAPRTSDIAFLGSGLFDSELFPLNVVLIATLAALAILLGCLVASLAEASLLRAAGHGTPGRSLAREVEAIFSVVLVAALPAVALAAATVSGAAAVAPGEFGAPDLGIPLALRVALRLAPLLVGLAVLCWLGAAFGAAAIRKVVGPTALPFGAAIRASLLDLARHLLRRLGFALAVLIADLVALLAATALLRLPWAPISAQLADGRLLSPSTLLLLVGFVAIWMATVLALGGLHAWASTWWSLELGTYGEAPPRGVQEGSV